MKKLIFSLLVLLISSGLSFGWGTSKGYSYHKFEVVDEYGRTRTDVNSVTIRTPATTSAQTIYKGDGALAITQPITETSTNTTLDRTTGTVYWYGGIDAWDFTITLDGGSIYANQGHMSLASNQNRIIFPSYFTEASSTDYNDADTASFGTDGDWTIGSSGATLQVTPVVGTEATPVSFNIGANTAGADFKLFGATTGSYCLWDSSADSLILAGAPITATGAAVNLNASSNFAINLATGTSTGTVTVGGTGVQTIAIGTGGTGAKTIGIGDGASTGTTTIKGGSGGVAINASNGTVATNIGTGTSTGTVTIGSATTTQAIAVNAGTGDLALTSTDDITLTTNTAVTDNIVITNTQGTAATAISLQATAGGIDIDGGSGADIAITSTGKSVAITATEAASDAIALTATTGAGGITASSGSGGINLNASVNQPVNIGTGTSSGTITLGGGSGLLAIATSSWDVATDGTMTNIGAITSGGLFTGTAGATITGATTNINASSNFATNINTGTSTGAVNIGSSTSGAFAIDTTSTVTVNADASQAYTVTDTVAGNAFTWDTTDGGMAFTAAGAANGDFSISAADDASITVADDLTLNGGSAGSIINLGTNTQGNAINIGSNDTTADTITVGSAKDTTAVAGIAVTVGSTGTTSATTLQSGTGDVSITSTDAITMTSAGAFNIGANAVAQTITVGNETDASSLALKAGTGNITIDGVAATTITIGDAAQTGTMKFGESTAAVQVDLATGNSNKTVNLGTGTGVSSINIGTGGTGAKTITIGDAASTGTTNIKAGSGGINITGSVIRTDQQYVQTVSYCKVGATAGWVVPAAADGAHLATLPQSQTASTLVIPITIPLKVGYTITGWTINGQIDSAGNAATLDARLYKHTEAEAGFTNAAIGSGMTQLSKTADYKVVEGEASLSEVVAADESYYLLVTGTTAATTDIEIASITVSVSEI
ncbi:MAG: hypothetical protein WC356_03555 [Candidatus Micrarchaeia archaeon]